MDKEIKEKIELLDDLAGDESDAVYLAMAMEMGLEVEDLVAHSGEEIDQFLDGGFPQREVMWKFLRIKKVWFVYPDDRSLMLKCDNQDQARMLARVLNQNNVIPLAEDIAEDLIQYSNEVGFDVEDDFGEGLDDE